ncbi:MAG TPA: 50S ribosomal protein L32 [Roseiflexaceae bacterium]|nr:50S ribosomal protein L32 [Roseiflexaceae bacterium]HMP39036.1 50S ribosomal protein L32 [Roseiflexaceae bacterium]
MGAVPKTKVSRHRRGNRRQHQRIDPPTLVTCQECNELMRAHRVCKNCGTYRGRQVIAMASVSETE